MDIRLIESGQAVKRNNEGRIRMLFIILVVSFALPIVCRRHLIALNCVMAAAWAVIMLAMPKMTPMADLESYMRSIWFAAGPIYLFSSIVALKKGDY